MKSQEKEKTMFTFIVTMTLVCLGIWYFARLEDKTRNGWAGFLCGASVVAAFVLVIVALAGPVFGKTISTTYYQFFQGVVK